MATVSVFYYREIGLFDAKVMLKIVFALRGIYAYNKHINRRIVMEKIELGKGLIEVCEGIYQGKYALMLAKDGTVSHKENYTIDGERLITVVQFNTIESLDILISQLNRLRERMVNDEGVTISAVIEDI